MVVFLEIAEALLCVALIAAVVMQSGKGGGMGNAIGGGADGVLGGKRKGLDEYLSKITMVLGALFAVVTLSLVKLMS